MLKIGLIGEKLGHSYSADIHKKMGYAYNLTEISPDKLNDFVKSKTLDAYNVTIPFKQAVMPLLDEIDKEANAVGSVNTVIDRNGKLIGYNTDLLGMRYALKRAKIELKDKKILILGTGGTSLTAKAVAEESKAKTIIVVGRNQKDNYKNIYLHDDANIIFNTTPVGMYPNNDRTPIDLDIFKNLDGVFDVIYNPLQTRLTLQAKTMGIKTANGLAMLVAQAVYAKDLFFESNTCDAVIEKILAEVEKDKRNIVLVGMPGCGKTSVGKKLSELTNKKFVDTDDLIKDKIGKTPAQIINEFGEKTFREIESEVISEITKNNSLIIAGGGGAVLNKENVICFKQNSIIFYIDRDLKKLSLEDRPLSSSFDKLENLFIQRKDIYEKVKDYKIDNNGEIDSCVEKIMEII